MALKDLQDGRYRPERIIGSGGMGEVYLMEDTRVKRHVAIKVIRSESAAFSDEEKDKNATRLFEREARAIAALEHPNILPLYDFGEEIHDDTVMTYMVMPYCSEGSLGTWLRQRGKGSHMPLADVAYIVGQAAEGLQYAHEQQMVHLDVKPPNFLLRGNKRNPNRPTLLLADFGIARSFTTVSTSSRTIRGTPTSMAPEQWRGEPVAATDQYALAVMAYELLTGRPPFSGSMEQLMYQHLSGKFTSPISANPALTEAINAVIMKALAKEPEDRFPTIADFADALQEAIQLSPGYAAEPSLRSGDLQRSTPFSVSSDDKLSQMVTFVENEETNTPSQPTQVPVDEKTGIQETPSTPSAALADPDTASNVADIARPASTGKAQPAITSNTRQQERNSSPGVPLTAAGSRDHDLPTVAVSNTDSQGILIQKPARSRRSMVFIAASIALVCVLIILLFAGAVLYLGKQQQQANTPGGVTGTATTAVTPTPTTKPTPKPTPTPPPGLYIAGSYNGSMTNQATSQSMQITVYLVESKQSGALQGSVTFVSPSQGTALLKGVVDKQGNFTFHAKPQSAKQPFYFVGQFQSGNFLHGNYCTTSTDTCLSLTGFFTVGPRF